MIRIQTSQGEYGLAFSYTNVAVLMKKNGQYVPVKTCKGKTKMVEQTTVTLTNTNDDVIAVDSVRPSPSEAPNRDMAQMYAVKKVASMLPRELRGEILHGWFERQKVLSRAHGELKKEAMKAYFCPKTKKAEASQAAA